MDYANKITISKTTISNQVHFLERRLLNFSYDWNMFPIGCNWQYGSIGSDNGLAPNRRQAIIWTNDRLPTYICVTRPQCPTGFILGNISVTGGFPSQRADNAGFGIFFDVSLNRRLNQPSNCRWFESPWHSLWRHCNTSRPMSYLYAPWKIWMIYMSIFCHLVRLLLQVGWTFACHRVSKSWFSILSFRFEITSPY